jgi:hypothetical protein
VGSADSRRQDAGFDPTAREGRHELFRGPAEAREVRHAIWDPVKLVGKFQNPVVVGFAMFSVVVATLAVNIAANVVSPANDFAT